MLDHVTQSIKATLLVAGRDVPILFSQQMMQRCHSCPGRQRKDFPKVGSMADSAKVRRFWQKGVVS
jgi:hypothetical protein